MPKRNLEQTWIYAGKFYGPGIVALPDDAAQAIDAKMAVLTPDAGAHETELEPLGTPPPENLASLQGVPVQPGSLAADLAQPGQISSTTEPPQLSTEIMKNLSLAGYASAPSIRQATDEQLLAVDGVGPATLRRLREVYGADEG